MATDHPDRTSANAMLDLLDALECVERSIGAMRTLALGHPGDLVEPGRVLSEAGMFVERYAAEVSWRTQVEECAEG